MKVVAWCSKCRSVVESAERACPLCGTELARSTPERDLSRPPAMDGLQRVGGIAEANLVPLLSTQYGVPAMVLDHVEIPADILALIPRDFAVRHALVPVQRTRSAIVVAMADPSNIFAIDDIKKMTRLEVEVVVASDVAVAAAVARCYPR